LRSKLKNKLNNFINLIDRLHWLWLGLAAPFLLFPTPERSLALLVIPGVWLLHWAVLRTSSSPNSSSPIPVTPFNGALLLLALMVLVSTWATYDIAVSLPAIANLVLGFGLLFAVVRDAGSIKTWLISLAIFVFGLGLGIAVIGLFGINWVTSKFSFLNLITERLLFLPVSVAGGEFGLHPNIVAGALLWVLPILIVVSGYLWVAVVSRRRHTRADSAHDRLAFMRQSKKWQLWSWVAVIWLATLYVGGILVLTQSRAGYLGLAISCLVVLFFALPGRWRWIFAGLLILTGFLIQKVYSNGEGIQAQEWLVDRGIASAGGFSLNTLEGRLELWSRAIYGIQDFSFTGMGMNTFPEVVHVLYPLFMVAPDVNIGHPHNEFLHAGLDLGIPGLIAFLSVYITAFWMLIQIWGKHDSQGIFTDFPGLQAWARPAALGLGGGLLAHMLYGLGDSTILSSKPGFMFWVLLGLIAGLFLIMNETQKDTQADISGQMEA